MKLEQKQRLLNLGQRFSKNQDGLTIEEMKELIFLLMEDGLERQEIIKTLTSGPKPRKGDW